MDDVPPDMKVPSVCELKPSSVEEDTIGAWSKQFIKEDTTFGPYEGEKKKISDNCDAYYSWEIKGPTGRRLFCIDASDPKKSNWMRYIKCARYYEEQNMVAEQQDRQIYYKTIKDVEAGEELLCWYNMPLPSEETYNMSKNDDDTEVKEVKKKGGRKRRKRAKKPTTDSTAKDEENPMDSPSTNSKMTLHDKQLTLKDDAEITGRTDLSRDCIDGDENEDTEEDVNADNDDADEHLKGEENPSNQDQSQGHCRKDKKMSDRFQQKTLTGTSSETEKETLKKSISVTLIRTEINGNKLSEIERLDDAVKSQPTNRPTDGNEKGLSTSVPVEGETGTGRRRYGSSIRNSLESDGIPELNMNCEGDEKEMVDEEDEMPSLERVPDSEDAISSTVNQQISITNPCTTSQSTASLPTTTVSTLCSEKVQNLNKKALNTISQTDEGVDLAVGPTCANEVSNNQPQPNNLNSVDNQTHRRADFNQSDCDNTMGIRIIDCRSLKTQEKLIVSEEPLDFSFLTPNDDCVSSDQESLANPLSTKASNPVANDVSESHMCSEKVRFEDSVTVASREVTAEVRSDLSPETTIQDNTAEAIPSTDISTCSAALTPHDFSVPVSSICGTGQPTTGEHSQSETISKVPASVSDSKKQSLDSACTQVLAGQETVMNTDYSQKQKTDICRSHEGNLENKDQDTTSTGPHVNGTVSQAELEDKEMELLPVAKKDADRTERGEVESSVPESVLCNIDSENQATATADGSKDSGIDEDSVENDDNRNREIKVQGHDVIVKRSTSANRTSKGSKSIPGSKATKHNIESRNDGASYQSTQGKESDLDSEKEEQTLVIDEEVTDSESMETEDESDDKPCSDVRKNATSTLQTTGKPIVFYQRNFLPPQLDSFGKPVIYTRCSDFKFDISNDHLTRGRRRKRVFQCKLCPRTMEYRHSLKKHYFVYHVEDKYKNLIPRSKPSKVPSMRDRIRTRGVSLSDEVLRRESLKEDAIKAGQDIPLVSRPRKISENERKHNTDADESDAANSNSDKGDNEWSDDETSPIKDDHVGRIETSADNKPLYPCNVCGKLLKSPRRHQIHMLTHPKESLLNCDKCSRQFVCKQGLSRHLLTHTGERPHSCKYCGKKFATTTNTRRHEKLHLGFRSHRCEQCSITFIQGTDLQRHIQSQHCRSSRPKAFKTKLKFGLKFRQALGQNRWGRSKGRRIGLGKVGNRFVKGVRKEPPEDNDLSPLKPPGQDHMCPWCGKIFTSHKGLRMHIGRVHKDNKNVEVQKTVKPPENKQNDEESKPVHSQKNTPSKTYCCRWCQKNFNTEKGMNTHIGRVHKDKLNKKLKNRNTDTKGTKIAEHKTLPSTFLESPKMMSDSIRASLTQYMDGRIQTEDGGTTLIIKDGTKVIKSAVINVPGATHLMPHMTVANTQPSQVSPVYLQLKVPTPLVKSAIVPTSNGSSLQNTTISVSSSSLNVNEPDQAISGNNSVITDDRIRVNRPPRVKYTPIKKPDAPNLTGNICSPQSIASSSPSPTTGKAVPWNAAKDPVAKICTTREVTHTSRVLIGNPPPMQRRFGGPKDFNPSLLRKDKQSKQNTATHQQPQQYQQSKQHQQLQLHQQQVQHNQVQQLQNIRTSQQTQQQKLQHNQVQQLQNIRTSQQTQQLQHNQVQQLQSIRTSQQTQQLQHNQVQQLQSIRTSQQKQQQKLQHNQVQQLQSIRTGQQPQQQKMQHQSQQLHHHQLQQLQNQRLQMQQQVQPQQLKQHQHHPLQQNQQQQQKHQHLGQQSRHPTSLTQQLPTQQKTPWQNEQQKHHIQTQEQQNTPSSTNQPREITKSIDLSHKSHTPVMANRQSSCQTQKAPTQIPASGVQLPVVSQVAPIATFLSQPVQITNQHVLMVGSETLHNYTNAALATSVGQNLTPNSTPSSSHTPAVQSTRGTTTQASIQTGVTQTPLGLVASAAGGLPTQAIPLSSPMLQSSFLVPVFKQLNQQRNSPSVVSPNFRGANAPSTTKHVDTGRQMPPPERNVNTTVLRPFNYSNKVTRKDSSPPGIRQRNTECDEGEETPPLQIEPPDQHDEPSVQQRVISRDPMLQQQNIAHMRQGGPSPQGAVSQRPLTVRQKLLAQVSVRKAPGAKLDAVIQNIRAKGSEPFQHGQMESNIRQKRIMNQNSIQPQTMQSQPHVSSALTLVTSAQPHIGTSQPPITSAEPHIGSSLTHISSSKHHISPSQSRFTSLQPHFTSTQSSSNLAPPLISRAQTHVISTQNQLSSPNSRISASQSHISSSQPHISTAPSLITSVQPFISSAQPLIQSVQPNISSVQPNLNTPPGQTAIQSHLNSSQPQRSSTQHMNSATPARMKQPNPNVTLVYSPPMHLQTLSNGSSPSQLIMMKSNVPTQLYNPNSTIAIQQSNLVQTIQRSEVIMHTSAGPVSPVKAVMSTGQVKRPAEEAVNLSAKRQKIDSRQENATSGGSIQQLCPTAINQSDPIDLTNQATRSQLHVQHGVTHLSSPSQGNTSCGGKDGAQIRPAVDMTTNSAQTPGCDDLDKASSIHLLRKYTQCRSADSLAQAKAYSQQLATKEKLQVTCNVCGRLFRSLNELNGHVAVHGKEWKYRCDVCLQLFKESRSLVEHRRQIHGIRPQHIFTCPACPQQFFTLVQLQLHQFNMHPNMVSTYKDPGQALRTSQNIMR